MGCNLLLIQALEVDEKNKLISRRLWDKNNMLAYNKEMQQEWL